MRRRPNKPIEIQQRVASRAGQIGGQIDSWEKLRADFAFVTDKNFRETNNAGTVVQQRGRQCTIRRDDTLTVADHRVLFDGTAYNIRALSVDDENMRSPYTLIDTDSGVAQ